MKLLFTGLVALMVTTTAAGAGGIDRASLPLSILFDTGTTASLSFSSATPSVSGDYQGPITFYGAHTENMAEPYATLGFAFKSELTDKLALALMFSQPYGADADYKGGAYTGLEAHWTSSELDAILKYRVTDQVSVYGGLRSVTSKADIKIPTLLLNGAGSYRAEADSNTQTGYILGAAYEKPDIALRASVTYQSAIKHDFATSELFTPTGGGETLAAASIPGGTNSTTRITLPQSLSLDVQTGIAANTLLFGSIKWTEWSKWHVDPTLFHGLTGEEITGFDNDVFTYQLGIGRKLNDNVSVFARVGYEKSNGGFASRLSPTDGRQSIGLGGSWSNDRFKVTGGLEYVKLGDAVDRSGTRFHGNSALGVGITMDVKF